MFKIVRILLKVFRAANLSIFKLCPRVCVNPYVSWYYIAGQCLQRSQLRGTLILIVSLQLHVQKEFPSHRKLAWSEKKNLNSHIGSDQGLQPNLFLLIVANKIPLNMHGSRWIRGPLLKNFSCNLEICVPTPKVISEPQDEKFLMLLFSRNVFNPF